MKEEIGSKREFLRPNGGGTDSKLEKDWARLGHNSSQLENRWRRRRRVLAIWRNAESDISTALF